MIGYIRKESSGNDHWIKDSRLSGNSRAPAVANGKCPLIKGSSVQTAFTSAICNSAYPFICEKNQVLVPPAGFFNQGMGGNMGGMGNMGGNMAGNMGPNMGQNFGYANDRASMNPNDRMSTSNGYPSGYQNNLPSMNPYNNFVQQQPVNTRVASNNAEMPDNYRYTMANMGGKNQRNSGSRNKNLGNRAPTNNEFTSLDDLDFEVQGSDIGGGLNFGGDTRGNNRFSDAVREDQLEGTEEEKPLSNTITGIIVTASLILCLLGGLYFWHMKKAKAKRRKLKKEVEAQIQASENPT